MSSIELIKDAYPGKVLLSSEEVGQLLGLRPKAVRNAIYAEAFPIRAKKLGRLLRFDVRDVADYLDNGLDDRH